MSRSAALLPTGTNVNPINPVNEYYTPGAQTLIIGRNERGQVRAMSTFGGMFWELGSRHEVRHDQNRSYLGTFTIIGAYTNEGEIIGEVPNKKIPFWVFK